MDAHSERLTAMDASFLVLEKPASPLHVSATLIDQFQPWGGLSFSRLASSTRGPAGNRYGDYFWVERHPTQPRTFLATGSTQRGSSSANPVHRFSWFGRSDYTPRWVTLSVQSTPHSPQLRTSRL